MGSYNSGRRGGRPTVESALTLDLAQLLRDRLLQPGQRRAGALSWTNSYTDARVASIGYSADLGEECGRLRLRYSTTRWNGDKHVSDDWIELVTSAQPFGGRRWWFVCPSTGEHVTRLYLPPGAVTFASREAHRLGYRSQREAPRDRAINNAFKLRRRLGNEGGIGEVIRKPKGMRWRTFEREIAKVKATEAVVTGHTWLLLQSLDRRLTR